MCGIAGCAVPAGTEPDRDALARMAAALRHRGPDDSGIEVVGNAGLVSTRLAIVDPSPAGHEPMSDPSGRWWLTYNGEVFNHLELRERLGDRGWRGGSDTETLAAALAEWGDGAPARCNGFFGFAALDSSARRLLLVRDRLGVKPLYWTRHAGAIWFASEIGALLAAGVPRRLDREALAYALLYGWVSGAPTPVEGVRRVLPGTLVDIDLDTLAADERRWYDPAADVDPERARALAGTPRAEVVDAVEAELRASVGRRLMADVGVGTLCSGGVDSSVVTAFARDHQPGIVAYNAAIADQPHADESAYAEQVARALGVELRTVRMTRESWREDLVSVVAHNEYPLTHESSVPMMQIARLARADGIKVLLSGEGADELFGGYGHMHLRMHLEYALRNRRVRTLAALAGAKLRRDGLPATARRALALARPRAGDGANARLHAGQFPGLVPSGAAAGYDQEWTARAAGAYAWEPEPSRRALAAELLRELGTYLPHLLNRQDKAAMQCSVETREPFLDRELVALALNLPLEVRMEPQRKAVLREIADRYLPAAISRRPKYGFGFDTRAYFEEAARPEFLLDGALRDVLEAPREGWAAAVARADESQLMTLWTGEVWHRLTIGAQPVAAVERELWR
jgi:asparagine synthase (glutamine-hydrolysing)